MAYTSHPSLKRDLYPLHPQPARQRCRDVIIYVIMYVIISDVVE